MLHFHCSRRRPGPKPFQPRSTLTPRSLPCRPSLVRLDYPPPTSHPSMSLHPPMFPMFHVHTQYPVPSYIPSTGTYLLAPSSSTKHSPPTTHHHVSQSHCPSALPLPAMTRWPDHFPHPIPALPATRSLLAPGTCSYFTRRFQPPQGPFQDPLPSAAPSRVRTWHRQSTS
jgi:hypothetical protein